MRNVFALTARESEVAAAAARGLRNKEIAEELHLAEGSIKRNLSRVFQKLRVRSRTELALRLTKAAAK